ncbi:hypothetical protein RDI58_001867 [Solanum bulbocastanum]|uniref:Uncharacterized protein n=1 Tax=Solanum bulbocastanum TaxID=147425 RepID=A0AAN8U8P9_SOLBU
MNYDHSMNLDFCHGPAPPAGLSLSSSQPTYATLIKTDTNLTPTTPSKPKEFSLIEKFSYGKPDMAELRKLFPQQLGIKGGCSFGINSGSISKEMGYISFDPEVSSNADRALATVPESGGASKNGQEHDNVAIATTC